MRNRLCGIFAALHDKIAQKEVSMDYLEIEKVIGREIMDQEAIRQ